MADLNNALQINAQTDDFISQVDLFLNKKQSQTSHVQQEMNNFLQLLGKVETQEYQNLVNRSSQQNEFFDPQIINNNSLSVIYSLSSVESSAYDALKTNYEESDNKKQIKFKNNSPTNSYKFIGRQIKDMQEFFQKLIQDKDILTVSKTIMEIASFYYDQMAQIDKQSTEIFKDIVNQSGEQYKRQIDDTKKENEILKNKFEGMNSQNQIIINSELDKIRLIELDLKKSLEQAQSFNERLSKLLSLKLQEQRFKDNQCALIQTQLGELQGNVQLFQNHFLGVNGQIKNLLERIQDVWTYNHENAHTNKIIEGILQDSHSFMSQISHINSNNESFLTNFSKSKEKSLSEIDHKSMRTGDHSLSTSARTITKQLKLSKEQHEPLKIKTDRKEMLLNNFRNHFITSPFQNQRKNDSSYDSYGRSNKSSSLKKTLIQPIRSSRRKEIESQYSKIFKHLK